MPKQVAVAGDGARHLDREFARGGHDQSLDAAGLAVEGVQERERERGRLAGAGVGLGQDITTGQEMGGHFDLDLGGSGVAEFGDGLDEFRAQAEIFERGVAWEGEGLSGGRGLAS